MKNSEKAKHIIKIIRQFVEIATLNYIKAKTDLAAAVEGSHLWEKECKDEFAWGNPYKIEIKKNIAERTRKEKIAREEILEYAMDVFLDKIE